MRHEVSSVHATAQNSGVRPAPTPAPAVMPRTTTQGATPPGALEKVHQLIILVIRFEIVEIIVPFVFFHAPRRP